MKILFITPYPPDEAPSQRFRFEQYLPLLKKKGFEYEIRSFFSLSGWRMLYQSSGSFKKAFLVFGGYLKRFATVFESISYDFVFIHREAAPFGPPVFEWIIAKMLKKKIIYDFDDAIWSTDKLYESSIESYLRYRRKVGMICRWSYKVSCGNQYLCNYARQFSTNVILNPTTIDADLHKFYKLSSASAETVIGWTGSHSTLKYLKEVEPVLHALQIKYPQTKFLVIADKNPNLQIPSLEFLPWKKESEIEDLSKIDIGIMPLPDDEWSKGKCGFKALQYMALSIPAVVSPVGVNTEIIQNNVNGFLCRTSEEWFNTLEALILDKQRRQKIGEAGKEKIMTHYTVSSNSANFLSLFE